MNLKKYFLFLTLAITSLQCTEKIDQYQLFLTKIGKLSLETPPIYPSFLLFGMCDSNFIFVTNMYELHKHFINKKTNQSFEVYLKLVLDKNKANCIDEFENIKLNENIKKEYERIGVSNLLHKYCKELKNGRYSLKAGIDESSTHTLLYYFYFNNYIATFDDYSGWYILTSMENITSLDSIY